MVSNLLNIEIAIQGITLYVAVEYLHSNGVVHRDFKLENLLCTEDGRIAITDFGFATVNRSADALLSTACGSPCYAAPELVLDKKVTRSAECTVHSRFS